MIALFTDFGFAGPYVGQMRAVLAQQAPAVPVIDLFADLPPFDAMGAAYLLAAYADQWPPGTVFLCVVDPGVGGDRRALHLAADGRHFVGPDNGLLAIAARRARRTAWRAVTWRPDRLSASFHGRDLFAPVAARLARGEAVESEACAAPVGCGWPDDLARVVYVDRYGNAMTGLRGGNLTPDAVLAVGSPGEGGQEIRRARTFSAVPIGSAFWYENANGLAEIAVNQGRADHALGLAPGTAVTVLAG